MEQDKDLMPWLTWLRSHIGEKELTGAPATLFNDEVFSHTNYGRLDGIMEPGCAATLCASLEETGLSSPHNASAFSFKSFGVPCDLVPGCIVLFQWANGEHHVSCCDHIVDTASVACLGGNQGHEVKISVFSRKYIIATRWPDVLNEG